MTTSPTEENSYIDYETFLAPDFSSTQFANDLILSTNNPTDTPLDLTTPLSRVLFDVQEIDTLIDSLSTKSALPLLDYTAKQSQASNRILDSVEERVTSLSESYAVLQKEVLERHESAEQVRRAAERLCETVRVAREVGRCLLLGRQLEAQMSEVSGHAEMGSAVSTTARKGDHRVMVRAANTLLAVRQVTAAEGTAEQKGGVLSRVDAIKSLKTELLDPSEKALVSKSQQIIREFSMSSLASAPATSQTTSTQSSASTSTFAQTEDTRSRTTAAILTLYLLSPPSSTISEPTLLIDTLTEYMQTSLKSSLASLAHSLATLPTLDRTLLEISARCQNILALEVLLSTIKPPTTTSSITAPQTTLLQPLLDALDTSSLPSFFWRTLSSNLVPRVKDIMVKGGVSARTLRSNKDKVRDSLRACVDKGSNMPGGLLVGEVGREKPIVNWEREAAVMVGSVIGALGR